MRQYNPPLTTHHAIIKPPSSQKSPLRPKSSFNPTNKRFLKYHTKPHLAYAQETGPSDHIYLGHSHGLARWKTGKQSARVSSVVLPCSCTVTVDT